MCVYLFMLSSLRAEHARAVNYRQGPTVGPSKDFQGKNRLPRLNGRYSKSKRDIVMGPTAKVVSTHRATNAPLTKIWLPKQKMRRLGPILGRGTFCNFWYQYSLFVFRIGDFFPEC